MATPNLGITHLTASQNNKTVTINASWDDFDNATQAASSIALAGDANDTLTSAEFNGAFDLTITGTTTANRVLFIPNNARLFSVKNETTGGFALTVRCTTPGSPVEDVIVPNGARTLMTCDGESVRKIASNYREINTQTGTTYTLTQADSGAIVEMSNASANTITLPEDLGFGFWCDIIQLGAGTTTVQADTTAVLNGTTNGSAAISTRYNSVRVYLRSETSWIMSGDHGAVT